MKALSLMPIILSAYLFCGITSPAISQDKKHAPEHEVDQNTAIKAFDITLQSDPDNRTGEPVHITVTITNISENDLLLRNIAITQSTAISITSENADRCEINQKGEILLRSGMSFEQDCQFHSADYESSGKLKRFRMRLLASKLKLMVMIDTKQLGKYRYYPSVSIPAQEYGIFIGGVLGATLLAAFVWIERVLKNPTIRANVIKSLLPTILMGLRGGIMAVIALLLGKSSQNSGAPIALTVTDFTGGLIVGLFSYPLAAWITSALKIDEILLSSSNDKKNIRKARASLADKKDRTKGETPQSTVDKPTKDIDQRDN